MDPLACSNLPWTSSLTLGLLARTKTYSPSPLNVKAWLSKVYTCGSPNTVAKNIFTFILFLDSCIINISALTSPGWQVAHTVLTRSPLEPVGLTSSALLVLPHAARVEGRYVLQPVGQARDLVGLVPGENTKVV